jgi:hypothetical protein
LADQPLISTQLIENLGTKKLRIQISVLKDEWAEFSFVLTADQAEKLAESLIATAREARGKAIIIPVRGSILDA